MSKKINVDKLELICALIYRLAELGYNEDFIGIEVANVLVALSERE